ncbi:hypothetical protein HID58_068419, partial [Brassica napus]
MYISLDIWSLGKLKEFNSQYVQDFKVTDKESHLFMLDLFCSGYCVYEITSHQPAIKAPENYSHQQNKQSHVVSYSSNLKQMIKLILRKKPEHRPTRPQGPSQFLNPCLQPYLLQCQNLSPIYLLVFPIGSPKDKTRRSLLPGNSSPQAASSTNGSEEKLETKKDGQEAETQEEVLEPIVRYLSESLQPLNSEVVAESECLSGSVEVTEAKTVKLRADLRNLFHRRVKKGQMECLLEKCAGLGKQEKYKALAGLLTPLGEEGVSARDTAICFATTLLVFSQTQPRNLI